VYPPPRWACTAAPHRNTLGGVDVVILRGVSGAGKSTWAAAQAGAVVCSADDYRTAATGAAGKLAHRRCFARFQLSISRGEALVLVDNLNLRRRWYSDYIHTATRCGYRCWKREFDGGFANVHGTPIAIVRQMSHWYEPDPNLSDWVT